jgi:2-haloacid dehalogenase
MLAVFDAYGTLFDVDAAARAAATEPGAAAWADRWPALAADWRAKQLAYSWLRGLAGQHADFETVTGDALDWALARHGLVDAALRARLMTLYRTLPPFPEAPAMLARLRAAGWRLAILSNGTPAMLADAVDSAGLAEMFEAVLSVEEVGVFKPAPQVYALVEARLATPPGATTFVSSNGWDAQAAAAFGMRAVWVNRTLAPAERLPGALAATLPDLTALPALLGA